MVDDTPRDIITQDLSIIEVFRQLCGEKTDDGYYLDVEEVLVPNFVEVDHEMVAPEIIIRPYITDRYIATSETSFDPYSYKYESKFNQATFQVDIYAKNIIDLLKIKGALSYRMQDVLEPDMIEYSENGFWVELLTDDVTPQGTGIYTVDLPETPLIRVKELDEYLLQVETQEELEIGTWFMDDSDLYVYPLNDINDVKCTVLLNGILLDNGLTPYESGLIGLKVKSSRKIRDREPMLERWSVDFAVSYRECRPRKLGEIAEEIEYDVQTD